jgi:acyl-CoA dehydrogenase
MLKPFSKYIKEYKSTIKEIFRAEYNQDKEGHLRGIPSAVMNQLGELSPSAVSIPESYRGRGSIPSEILSLLEHTAYESLPLALIFGINGALFLEPLAKYGQKQLKENTFSRFIDNNTLGGLMITEPDHGTDALAMKTHWERTEKGYRIKGEKHWAGLSGMADFWIMTARERLPGADLKRDIDFFVSDSSVPGQIVEPVEYYNNLGLYMIPYARNRVAIEVPAHHRLIPVKSGIRLMQDLLHRSRLRFAGSASGFIHRMLDEAVNHSRRRFVSGNYLFSYDQVQKRLADLQADYTISSAFCRHSSRISSIDNDLSDKSLEANIHKSVLSDMMHNASQSLLQLVGAKGYRLNHIAGRSLVDSRPFQIFEGSNDVIYHQIADQFIKYMKAAKSFNLFHSLMSHPLTSGIAHRIKKLTEFSINPEMAQRKKVDFGKILGKITAMEWTMEMGNSGYDQNLITQALDALTERVQGLISGFHGLNLSNYIPEHEPEHSSWISTV